MYVYTAYIHTTTETRFPRTKVLQSGHTRTNWRRRSSVTQGAGSDQCVSIKYLRRRVSSILLGLGGCTAPVLPIVAPSRPQLFCRCLHCELKWTFREKYINNVKFHTRKIMFIQINDILSMVVPFVIKLASFYQKQRIWGEFIINYQQHKKYCQVWFLRLWIVKKVMYLNRVNYPGSLAVLEHVGGN